MSNEVFANGREIACKAADGKSIGAFPDVCFTPPQTPATPPGVPVPYPNTAYAKDTTKGSKTVKISNKEVMLKNKSHFKKSTGNEAGRAPKTGIVTRKIQGKVYFTSWSPNVKVEGKNVVRHLDLTTHNHGSATANTGPQVYVDSAATESQEEKCNIEKNKEKEICAQGNPDGSWKEMKDGKEVIKCSEACENAKACVLMPKKDDKQKCCYPDNTGHHLFPNSLLQRKRGDSATNVNGLRKPDDPNAYTEQGGLCVCVNRFAHEGKHKALHDATKEQLVNILEKGGTVTYEQVIKTVTEAHAKTFVNKEGKPQCDPKCIGAQINESISKSKTSDDDEIELRQQDGITRKDYSQFKNIGSGK